MVIREDEITIEDVKIAVKILRKWIRQTREAERVLRELAGATYMAGGPRGDLFKWIMEQSLTAPAKAREMVEGEEEDFELSEEELKRFREIAEYYKPKKKSG